MKRDDEDCFCALGVYAAERGYSVEVLDKELYHIFDDAKHTEEIKALVAFLAPLVGYDVDEDDFDREDSMYVYLANDKRNWPRSGGVLEYGRAPYTVPASKIKEALKLVGIDVELNDKRLSL